MEVDLPRLLRPELAVEISCKLPRNMPLKHH
jgi:hypothetical protein